MTIQEAIAAIKSGKMVRRAAHPGTLYFKSVIDDFDGWKLIDTDDDFWEMNLADIMADDWEVKREPTVIWINVYPGGFSAAFRAYSTEADAKLFCMSGGVTKKFIEVIDEN